MKKTFASMLAGVLLGAALLGGAQAAVETYAAQRSAQKFYVDGERVQMEAYSINGSNYKKNKTLDGCPELSWEEMEKLKAAMARSWREDPKPYEGYVLSNNNAVIRQTAKRIEELTRVAETEFVGWEFQGGGAEISREGNRLQLRFDEKPDADVREELKSYGFHWSPSAGVWQRQLSAHVFEVADKIAAIRPLSGELPSELQAKRQAELAVSETPAAPRPSRTKMKSRQQER